MQERLGNLGEGIDSGTVVELLVATGDTVTRGQTLFEIESEKAVVPIPASQEGTIARLLVNPGDTITVGQAILEYASVGESDSSATDSTASQESTADASQPSPPQDQTPSPIKTAPPPPAKRRKPTGPQPASSPTVKRIAHQLDLDLRLVPTASPGGRVTLADLRHWIHALIHTESESSSENRGPTSDSKKKTFPFEQWGPIRREPMTEIRKAISRHMRESKNAQPHVTQFESVDITDLEATRKSHAPQWKTAGAPLTLTALSVKACVVALQKHPILNASVDEVSNEIVFKDYYHIGIATDTEHGLMVPVIRDADKLTLEEIARAIPALAAKARQRKLTREEMTGGTFTISNQGGIGGGHFTPVINRPESAILGIGRGTQQAAVVDNTIVPRLILPLTVSYDHRTIDGGTAVRFTLDLIEALRAFTAKDLNLPTV